MCSAEGCQSREELPVSEACWTTYTFRTAAPVCQRRVSTNPLCSHYLPDSFFSPFPFLIFSQLCGDLCSCRCLSLHSFHVSYHIFDLSLLFAGAWKSEPQWVVRARGFEHREVTGELILTSPSPQRLSNTWRVFGHRGFLFSWAWSFGFEMKQEKTHTFNI